MNTWQIIHVPDKRPIPPNQQPTVNVIASVIKPKLANTIIRCLNQVAPLENLRHVKRIQKKFLGGKTQLSMILCLADENDKHMNSLPPVVLELVNSYHSIDGITGFTEEDSQSIISFMKSAVELAKSGDCSIVNAAVIVDPSVKQVIARACDQICCCSTSTEQNSSKSCSKRPEVLSSHLCSNEVASHMPLPSNDFPGETRQSYSSVSCLNPWQWAQKKSHTTSCFWHPLRHAVMAAIESSAARDRHFFPVMGHDGEKSNGADNVQPTSIGTPTKRQKTDLANIEIGEELYPSAEGFHPESARPYLCTGYDIYLVWEPCVINIDGITGFTEEDSQSIISFMKSAVELAKSGDCSIVNAAVIVDPSVKQVIASACDQICCCSTYTEQNSSKSCSKQPEVLSSHLCSNEVASHMPLPSNDFPGETRQSYSSVSCLNPWQWAQKKSHTTSCFWHPLRHAVMAAIESSAARDRHFFPVMGHDGEKSNGADNVQPTSIGTPTKRQKTDLANIEIGEELYPSAEGFHPESARPYLCTGYDIYLVWEPCVMCAMALIHQRIRRIFYTFPNPQDGALGSVHRLQGEKNLNHHYAVFRVLLPKEIHHTDETAAAKTTAYNANATTACPQDSRESTDS